MPKVYWPGVLKVAQMGVSGAYIVDLFINSLENKNEGGLLSEEGAITAFFSVFSVMLTGWFVRYHGMKYKAALANQYQLVYEAPGFTQDDLADLPIHDKAFVRSGNKLFLVSRLNLLCKEIDMPADKLAAFDTLAGNLISADGVRDLTLDELKGIQSLIARTLLERIRSFSCQQCLDPRVDDPRIEPADVNWKMKTLSFLVKHIGMRFYKTFTAISAYAGVHSMASFMLKLLSFGVNISQETDDSLWKLIVFNYIAYKLAIASLMSFEVNQRFLIETAYGKYRRYGWCLVKENGDVGEEFSLGDLVAGGFMVGESCLFGFGATTSTFQNINKKLLRHLNLPFVPDPIIFTFGSVAILANGLVLPFLNIPAMYNLRQRFLHRNDPVSFDFIDVPECTRCHYPIMGILAVNSLTYGTMQNFGANMTFLKRTKQLLDLSFLPVTNLPPRNALDYAILVKASISGAIGGVVNFAVDNANLRIEKKRRYREYMLAAKAEPLLAPPPAQWSQEVIPSHGASVTVDVKDSSIQTQGQKSAATNVVVDMNQLLLPRADDLVQAPPPPNVSALKQPLLPRTDDLAQAPPPAPSSDVPATLSRVTSAPMLIPQQTAKRTPAPRAHSYGALFSRPPSPPQSPAAKSVTDAPFFLNNRELSLRSPVRVLEPVRVSENDSSNRVIAASGPY